MGQIFFNVTWPAMMLFLKSCVEKQQVVGKPLVADVATQPKEKEIYRTMGFVLTEITPEDSLQKPDPTQVQEDFCSAVMGEIGVQPEPPLMGDTIIIPVDTIAKELPAIKSYEPMDTINIVSYETKCTNRLIAGGISIVKVEEAKPEPVEQTKTNENPALVVFPNPVRLGEQLTIKFSSITEAPKQVQLFSATGQLATTIQNQRAKENSVLLTIPSSIVPGTYFLKVTGEKLSTNTAKILVIN